MSWFRRRGRPSEESLQQLAAAEQALAREDAALAEAREIAAQVRRHNESNHFDDLIRRALEGGAR